MNNEQATAEQIEGLEVRLVDTARNLFGAMQNQLADEIKAEHGFRPRFFMTDAEVASGGDVERRSARQIDDQVTPIVSVFGWAPLISREEATWYSHMKPRDTWRRRRRGRPAPHQAVLRWRASDPGVLELTGIDGAVEQIVCMQQLLWRLMEIGSRSDAGDSMSRAISKLGISMIKKAKRPE